MKQIITIKKKDILKKKFLSIMHKTKKIQKKSQENTIKNCHKNKKTRLKNTKEKGINIKKKREKKKFLFLHSIKND